jgi:CRP-like cAMP-binding protein
VAEARKKTFKAGSFLYIEMDEDSDEVFVLESGDIELSGMPGFKRFRPMLSPGDIAGFTSCLCRRPRMETAAAKSDCVVAAMERECFLELVRSNAELAPRIISYFAEELRVYDDMMLGSSYHLDLTGGETRLFELGELFLQLGRTDFAAHAFSSYLEHYPSGMHAAQARSRIAEKTGKELGPAVKGLCKEFTDGQMIFCEHEPGRELYIIKSGKVEITKITSEEEILLSVLREGEIFGELSIVSNKPRNASAIAVGEAVLLPISRETLPTVFERSPEIITRLLAAVSQRIWFTFIRLQSRFYENPITRAYVLLENKLMEDRISLAGTKTHVVSLGLAELMAMSGAPESARAELKRILTDDSNLSFHFRQLTIESPKALASKAHFYRTRDRLGAPARTWQEKPRKPGASARHMGLDLKELRVPPESIPDR